MEPDILQLKRIFEEKLSLYKRFRSSVDRIDEMIQDTAVVYDDEHHNFIEALLPIVDRFIELNSQLEGFGAWPNSELGKRQVFEAWRSEMMQIIGGEHGEQEFLKKFLRPMLVVQIKRGDPDGSWKTNFEHFKGMLDRIRLDLTYFSKILQSYVKAAVYHLINLVNSREYNKALAYMEQQKNSFSAEEHELFRELIGLAGRNEFNQALELLGKKGSILEDDELKLLSYAIKRLSANLNYILSALLALFRSGNYDHVPNYLAENREHIPNSQIRIFNDISILLSRGSFSEALSFLDANKKRLEGNVYNELRGVISGAADHIRREARRQALEGIAALISQGNADYTKANEAVESSRYFSKDEKRFIAEMVVHVQEYTFDISIAQLGSDRLFSEEEREFLIRILAQLRDSHFGPWRQRAAEGSAKARLALEGIERSGGFFIGKGAETPQKNPKRSIFRMPGRKKPEKPEKVDAGRRRFLGKALMLGGAVAGGALLAKNIRGFNVNVGAAEASIRSPPETETAGTIKSIPETQTAPVRKEPPEINRAPIQEEPHVSLSSGLNVLIIGSDYLKERAHLVSSERADGLLAVNINRDRKTVKILTIPRDTLVKIPGRAEEKDKINHALTYGGWKLQKLAVENFLGIRFEKVIFINQDQLREIAHIVKEDIGYGIFAKIWWHVGLRDSRKLSESFNEEIHRASTDRSYADSAVGRAKAHAKLAGAVIKVLAESCRDAAKGAILLDKQWIGRVLKWISSTPFNLTADEVFFLFNELKNNQYKIELHYVPGNSFRARYAHFLRLNKNGLSCWNPKEYHGREYFSSVTSDPESLIVKGAMVA